MRRTTRRLLTISSAVAAGSLALAGPAAADHLLTVHPVECAAGAFTGVGFPTDISTRHVKIRDNRDGTVTATCKFWKIPLTMPTEYEEDGVWDRPGPGTVYSDPLCFLNGPRYDVLPVSVGGYGIPAMEGAHLTWGRNGKAVATCTFDLENRHPQW